MSHLLSMRIRWHFGTDLLKMNFLLFTKSMFRYNYERCDLVPRSLNKLHWYFTRPCTSDAQNVVKHVYLIYYRRIETILR